MDKTGWCWGPYHHPNSWAGLPDFWNNQEGWTAPRLFSWSDHWWQGFKLWKEETASLQHHDLHPWKAASSHGWKSLVWLFQLANPGDRWSWSLPWSWIPANYEWNHWKFTSKKTNLVILCYSNKVWSCIYRNIYSMFINWAFSCVKTDP